MTDVLSSPRPPGSVSTAAVLTWVMATGTAVLTLGVGVGALTVLAPTFDAFGNGLRWYVAGAVLVVLALSAVANLAALHALRGRTWGRWTLVVVSVVAAVAGLFAAYYVIPVLVTIAAAVVVTLLLTPSARTWFRARAAS